MACVASGDRFRRLEVNAKALARDTDQRILASAESIPTLPTERLQRLHCTIHPEADCLVDGATGGIPRVLKGKNIR